MGRTSLQQLDKRVKKRDQTPIIVTWNVVEYRAAAEKYVCKDDVVLEVGCCGGLTTALIGKIGARAVGIDQTETEIRGAKQRFERAGLVEFEVMDGFDIQSILKLEKRIGRKFNMIFVDINGSRDIPTLWACVDKLEKSMRPKMMVIKSVKVRMMLRQCEAFEMEEGVDPGATSPRVPSTKSARADARNEAGSGAEESGTWAAADRQAGVEAEQEPENLCPACGVVVERSGLVGAGGGVGWATFISAGLVLFAGGFCLGRASGR